VNESEKEGEGRGGRGERKKGQIKEEGVN